MGEGKMEVQVYSEVWLILMVTVRGSVQGSGPV